MIRRLLRRLGLVPRSDLQRAEEKLRAMRQRLEKTAERLAQATVASAQAHEARREEARRYKSRVAELESARDRQEARARDAAVHASRRIAALEQELRARDAQIEAAAREESLLERRVTSAMEDLAAARASLAGIEVKLDILEGAANVLDARVRPTRRPADNGSR